MKLVLLAAGASRRMRGVDKLLQEVDGLPLLRRQALALLATGAGPVGVTLPCEGTARQTALDGLSVTLIPVPDAAQGMSASLRAAADWAQDQPLLVCPADMPELTAMDFAHLIAAFEGTRPARATAQDGTPGHPVLFPASLLALLTNLTGDEGARSVLQAHPPQMVALAAQHATTDLDTPEDWSDWRAKRP
ncbi:nucleotidyltransferase family protein [Pararhodobacter zhoushanensis]|uniref:Nucleotidyltransferase family protein n=1 Tax=Pararhodobacter zhoushanensis TaxID=2479545 RepID=A0ABT3H088_9RHOB|nr:nucleotidyltransferase family protein [Pararhodobacter zhoushanensis]MCW1933221.1 nucleotidyltransferase family protein [Pararhodobacter zhoushanensis]